MSQLFYEHADQQLSSVLGTVWWVLEPWGSASSARKGLLYACVGWGGCWERNAQCWESCEYFWCSVLPSPPAPDFVIPWKNIDSCNEADLRMVSYINCKHFYLLHLSCSFPFQPSTLLFRVRGESTLQQVCCGLFPMDVLRTVENSGYQCFGDHWRSTEWRLWWDDYVQDEKIHSWVISRCQPMHFIWSIGKISSGLVD